LAFEQEFCELCAEARVTLCDPLVSKAVDGVGTFLRLDFRGVVIDCGLPEGDVLQDRIGLDIAEHMAYLAYRPHGHVGVARLDGLDRGS